MTDKQQTVMKQTLIKITDDHYVVVDDSEIKEGDYHFDFDKNEIDTWKGNLYSNRLKCKKITHSTIPLESMNHGNYSSSVYLDIEKLSLQEVKELIGEVDVEKKADEFCDRYFTEKGKLISVAYKSGYNQALEDNKDKKYTEEDMRAIFMHGYLLGVDRCNYSKDMEDAAIHYYFQPQIQWEVTFDEQDKLRLV